MYIIKNKIITINIMLAFLITSIFMYGYSYYTKYNSNLNANAQSSTSFVTINVEQYTPNHLPNITGTCSIGDTMNFTIKKGSNNTVSETLTKVCTTSPYSWYQQYPFQMANIGLV
jgi:hypothetical protein